MIHYHGAEGVSKKALANVFAGRHVFISYAHHSCIEDIAPICSSFALDNGAFSFWKSGKATDWKGYYEWVEKWHKHPAFDWALIPDVIDGSEMQNQQLLREWPLPKHIGVPIWHVAESLIRLENLCRDWPRVAIGSSGVYSSINTVEWRQRMTEVWNLLCRHDEQPRVKIHGLRMLNPNVFTKYPFASCDSTTVSLNSNMNTKYKHLPQDEVCKANHLANVIELQQSAQNWEEKQTQQGLF